MESLKTMRRPPITLKFLRKKLRSKIRPYPNACTMTTPRRPPTAYSECFLRITAPEPTSIVYVTDVKGVCILTAGATHKDVDHEEHVRDTPREMSMSIGLRRKIGVVS